ncbi:carbonic anhydrase 2-like [Haliotis cracherodii]|uniref:carbonic anhydrase 2-like n=1 Tax=Haliotis cracherodii TaxID=6455 RepID=UPI0039EA95C1
MSPWILASGLVLCNLVVPGLAGGGNTWSYEGQLGPAHWQVDYPECGGFSQSPVDVDTSLVMLDSSLTHFNLTQLSKTNNVTMLLENVQGHTVEVHLSGEEINVEGGGLDTSYGVKQFHFHWGAKDERGSEHTINGRHFPMEMHIVMYSHKYSNFDNALTKRKGLSVLGFFFRVGKTNANFDKLLNYFDQIEHSEDTYSIPTFPIMTLLPEDFHGFYRYEGSLTTPPCSETVLWTLFTETIEVAEEQLEKFRHIKRTHIGERDQYVTDVFRPLQPRNSRVVTTNYANAIYNDADRISSAWIYLLVLFVGIIGTSM